ncbi:hypothetical protein BpHYR1_046791 [Brachionus plicatilis]|uniref:Uncharacterized protein n=1 Tax=Brachionus plicatilis TaxID=10195 RepID=A0A3M7QR23_BRAPC|nr:hypothetical protein BpHYR1_046791 [Brachionus plicatilis]
MAHLRTQMAPLLEQQSQMPVPKECSILFDSGFQFVCAGEHFANYLWTFLAESGAMSSAIYLDLFSSHIKLNSINQSPGIFDLRQEHSLNFHKNTLKFYIFENSKFIKNNTYIKKKIKFKKKLQSQKITKTNILSQNIRLKKFQQANEQLFLRI